MDKEIAVCPHCGNPLQSTLIIRKAEWFCVKCRWAGGIFDERTMDNTPELEAKYQADKLVFEEHEKHIFCLGGGYRTDCAKCDSSKGQQHFMHLTPEETEKQTNAMRALGLLS